MVACLDARKQLSTAKPMVKGFNFYKSGHVLNVKSCLKNNKTFIKSLVLPSMRKTSAYSCFIVLTNQGSVSSASCGCPAGIDGRCNHIAATLFALEVFCKSKASNEREANEAASTSKPCRWNIPRKRKGDVLPISKSKFQKHEYGKEKTERLPEISEDVRSPNQRSSSNTRLYNILAKVEKFQEETGKEIGLSHILKQKSEKQLKECIKHDHYYCLLSPSQDKDSDKSDEAELLSPIKAHPISLDELFARCERVKKALMVSNDDVLKIESSTRNQSLDKDWHHQRKFRITASKAYRCAVMKESTSPTKALKEVLHYNKPFATKAMKEGISQEPQIIQDYLAQKGSEGITVEKCGFFVSLSHPFLGASPDGIVNDHGDSGLLEMKFIQQSETETLEEALIKKRICVATNGNLELNKNYQYFYQVQQQMFVTGKKWEDFVVKGSLCNCPLFIQRVFYDEEFWKPVLVKLEDFFNNCMIPEIAYPRIKYGNARLNLSDKLQ